MSRRLRSSGSHPALLLAALVLPGAAPPLFAQSPEEPGARGPARYSLQWDLGASLPGTLYDGFITRNHRTDPFPQTTRWREETGAGLQARVAMRAGPESGVGGYLALSGGRSASRAFFSGGSLPPERVERSVSSLGGEGGISMRIADWDQGRGLVDYHVGVVVLRQSIDLEPGHRNAFVHVGPGTPVPYDGWSRRVSTGWGLSLGTSFRLPAGKNTAIRVGLSDFIVPTNAEELAEQERSEARAVLGESVPFRFNRYTQHRIAVSLGVEYVLSRAPRRNPVGRRLPMEEGVGAVAPAVQNALGIATAGDTALALAALEHRVGIAPGDPHAWRELALLRAARGELEPSLRPQALGELERALNMNPGDLELLAAYGRLRGLAEREGRLVEAAAVRPLELSELALEAGPAGRLRVAWATRGLGRGDDGGSRYRAEVQVLDGGGEPVPIRPTGGGVDREEDTLVLTGRARELPLLLAVDLFLPEPRPGIYTVRVRLLDEETGQRSERSRGFEIPAP